MGISERIYIKVDSNDTYNSSGASKNLIELHTHNEILFPRKNTLESLRHTVLKSIDSTVQAYNHIVSSNTDAFVNSTYGVDFSSVKDKLSDCTPLMKNKIYKSNVDYPVMHPYMVSLLDSFSNSYGSVEYQVPNGTYEFNNYGCGGIPVAGIVKVQGGGGGSGGTNYDGSDAAGGGGGGGGFCMFYYRIKNTTSKVSVTFTTGSGGSRGGGSGSYGSGNGGTGGTSTVKFTTPSGTCTINAEGGKGGQTGNRSYNSGGNGGGITTSGATTTNLSVSGGSGGSEGGSPGKGTLWNTFTTSQNGYVSGNNGGILYDDNYLYIYMFVAIPGGGGGRADDTSGSAKGQGGAGTHSHSSKVPKSYTSCTTTTLSNGGKSGGSAGASVTDAQSGGGGASASNNGASGGGKSTGNNGTSAKAGSRGAGAGGAGCGENYWWYGAKGGDGYIAIMNT